MNPLGNGIDPIGFSADLAISDFFAGIDNIEKEKEGFKEVVSKKIGPQSEGDRKITTKLFATEANRLTDISEEWCDFYEIDLKDRKITIAEGSDLPLSEEKLAIIMVSEKENEKPVVMAYNKHAEEIRKSKLRLHELSHKGKEAVRVLEGKDITIKSLDEEQYRRISGVAIRAIQSMSEQSKAEKARKASKAAKESLRQRSVEVLTGKEHRGDVQKKYPDLKAIYALETQEEHAKEQLELEREGIESERSVKGKKKKRDDEYDLKLEHFREQDAKKARLQKSNLADDIKKERSRQ